MALSGVARAQKRAGLQAIADMLRGADDERTRRFGFTGLSTFGLLKAADREWIVALLRALLAAGWIDLTPTEHPVPFVTRAGGDVMRGHTPARLVLPKPKRPKAPSRRDEANRKQDVTVELEGDDRALFEVLRGQRAELARQKRVPAYVIALDRTLVELAARKPRSLDALSSIYGFGPSRIEQYGQAFLDALEAHPITGR
jgi:ATP-dependent DNA helicase RecQ